MLVRGRASVMATVSCYEGFKPCIQKMALVAMIMLVHGRACTVVTEAGGRASGRASGLGRIQMYICIRPGPGADTVAQLYPPPPRGGYSCTTVSAPRPPRYSWMKTRGRMQLSNCIHPSTGADAILQLCIRPRLGIGGLMMHGLIMWYGCGCVLISSVST